MREECARSINVRDETLNRGAFSVREWREKGGKPEQEVREEGEKEGRSFQR
jgi:hypothetical protein